MIVLPCKCGKSWKAPAGAGPGTQIACPACKNILVVPGSAPVSTGAAVAAPETDSRLRELERALADARESLRQKDVEVQEFSARIAELETEARAAAEVKGLQQQIRQAVAERESLNALVARLREEHTKELESAFSESAEKDKRIQALEAKEREFQTASARKDDLIRALEARLAESAKSSGALEEELRAAAAAAAEKDARLRALEKETEDAKLRITESERELRDLEKALEDWRGKCQALERSLASEAETKRRDLERAVAERETVLRERDQGQEALREENRKLREELEDVRTQAELLREEVLRVQQHQALAEQRLRGNEEARRIAVQTRSLIADLEKELGDATGSLARMHDRIMRALGTLTIPADPTVDAPLPPETPVVEVVPKPEERIAVPIPPPPPEEPPSVEAEVREIEELTEERELTGKVVEPTPAHGLPAVPAPAMAPAESLEEAEERQEPAETAEEPADEDLEPAEQPSRSVEEALEALDPSEPAAAARSEAGEDADPVPLIDRGEPMEEAPAEEPAPEEAAPAGEAEIREIQEGPEAEASPEAEEKKEPPKKRGFFSRLFGKK